MAHFSCDVQRPVFCLGFVDPDKLVVGGGGGSGRSGVKNRLVVYKVDLAQKRLDEICAYECPPGDDCPMSLLVDRRVGQQALLAEQALNPLRSGPGSSVASTHLLIRSALARTNTSVHSRSRTIGTL